MAKPLSTGRGWVVAQVFLWILQLSLPWGWAWTGWPNLAWGPPFAGWGLVAAVAVGSGGAWLAMASLRALGPNLTAVPKPKEGSVLVVRGPYRRIRHPIYTALVLLFLAWALAWNNPVLVVLDAGLFVLLRLKSRLEERWLVDRYPQYPAYRASTGALVPRFNLRRSGST